MRLPAGLLAEGQPGAQPPMNRCVREAGLLGGLIDREQVTGGISKGVAGWSFEGSPVDLVVTGGWGS